MSKILNGLFENNNEEVKLGTEVSPPLPKTKKDPRTNEKPTVNNPPWSHQKILSKIFIIKTEDKINTYLAHHRECMQEK